MWANRCHCISRQTHEGMFNCSLSTHMHKWALPFVVVVVVAVTQTMSGVVAVWWQTSGASGLGIGDGIFSSSESVQDRFSTFPSKLCHRLSTPKDPEQFKEWAFWDFLAISGCFLLFNKFSLLSGGYDQNDWVYAILTLPEMVTTSTWTLCNLFAVWQIGFDFSTILINLPVHPKGEIDNGRREQLSHRGEREDSCLEGDT